MKRLSLQFTLVIAMGAALISSVILLLNGGITGIPGIILGIILGQLSFYLGMIVAGIIADHFNWD